MFIDLERACDRYQEKSYGTMYYMRKSEGAERHVRVVQDIMYKIVAAVRLQ